MTCFLTGKVFLSFMSLVNCNIIHIENNDVIILVLVIVMGFLLRWRVRWIFIGVVVCLAVFVCVLLYSVLFD